VVTEKPNPRFADMPVTKSVERSAMDAALNSRKEFCLGILSGEGIGPEVMEATMDVFEVLLSQTDARFDIRHGGPIGLKGLEREGSELPASTSDFIRSVLSDGGAILSGPGGGRYVYELRRQFGLSAKLNPIESFPELVGLSAFPSNDAKPVNLLLVRENLEGLYQGTTSTQGEPGECVMTHTSRHSESCILQLLGHAVQEARNRSGKLTVIVKESGIPGPSRLWRDCAEKAIAHSPVCLQFLEVDFAAYQMVRAPWEFDVVASPNCFGDILSDLGGLVMGGRGMTYGASFSYGGMAVYQTNHGSAWDIAGLDQANPCGQLLSLAFLLRKSFGLIRESDILREAIRKVWAEGWRTADMMRAGDRLAGTREMGRLIAAQLASA
jgi:3-isopropylmalate dehydrogenase